MDLIYNASTMLKEYWTYDELNQMPLRMLLYYIDYFTPKFQEIAKRQEEERLKMELEGKRRSAVQNKSATRRG